MNKFLVSSIIILLSTPLFSQNFQKDSIQVFIDKSIEIIKLNAIDPGNIDLIKSQLYSKAKGFKTLDSVAPLYADVFKQLNDHHGNLTYKGNAYGWNRPSTHENPYLKKYLKKEKKIISNRIGKDIAYIRIPGNDDFAFKKVDSIAHDIAEHVNSINSDRIAGWIVDLRLNTGGNMYPILLGLKEFIGNNVTFGGFKNAKNEFTGKWEVKDGKMFIDNIELIRSINLDYPVRNDIPVIILTSSYTASAGEMTAISFIGRENTYIIGEPTADYTTAVQGFEINESAGINLSTDYVVDRNSKIYKSNIQPDFEVIGGDDLENLSKDRKITKALEILKQ